MPQPLSRVRPKADIHVSANAISSVPLCASHVVRVIATWAEIDSDLAIILSKLLKADVEIGTAMYQALSGGEARKAAFMAAAKVSLAEWQFILVKAVFDATRASRNQRNDFAHHIWGQTPSIPDALLLMPPEVVLDRHLSFMRAKPDPKTSALVLTPKSFDYDKIMVWRGTDFVNAVELALTAAVQFAYLYGAIGHPLIEQSRRLLLMEPRVQQALQPLIRDSSLEVQELLRPPVDGEPPPAGPMEVWDAR